MGGGLYFFYDVLWKTIVFQKPFVTVFYTIVDRFWKNDRFWKKDVIENYVNDR